MEELNLIPQLRFSEFSEEWEEKMLGEICSVERGKFTPRPRNNPIYYNGEIPFVQTGDVVHSKGIINTHSQTLNEKGLKVSKLFKKGDLLITIAANIGYAGVLQYDMACPDSLIGLKCTSQIKNYFLNYLLEIEQPKMDYLAVAAAQKNINIDFLKPYKLSIPIPTEQTKIATFLTAVDKRINLLQKKKVELEQYKKGVMQKLFSQKLRFKKEDGSDFEDWEEKTLGEIGNTFNGLTGKTKVDFGKGKPYIQYMQIFSNSRIDTSNFGLVDVDDDENQSIAQFGDVFFTTSSETPNEIGMSSVLTEQVEDVYLNSFCFGYRPNSLEELVPEFSQFFFRSSKVRKEIIKLAQGSTRFNMSKVAFMKLKFNFPKKGEQQKIANFLSSIDKSIENISNQIEDSVMFKKGLLQKMFV